MSVFDLHEKSLSEYRDFVRSFVQIADDRLREYVNERILADNGEVWPEPLIQLSPLYQYGETVDELAKRGILHPTTAEIFRRPDGSPFHLYLHQVKAIEHAAKQNSYVLTSGTGSGKSFTYFIPIIDYAVRYPKVEGPMAIVVYPMNALVNSQLNALQELSRGYERRTGKAFPLRFARYTGQTTEDERREIRETPPHLILTNYVMGEFLMVRPEDKKLVNPPAAEAPFFLVFDELHTYRGRQGADVAMLIRRLRSRIVGRKVIHVGTSATLLSRKGAPASERKEAVSNFASLFFGADIPPENIVEETLQPITQGSPPTNQELIEALGKPLPETLEEFRANPLVRFVEHAMGLEQDSEAQFRRRTPRTISSVAEELAERANLPVSKARDALVNLLNRGAAITDGGRPVFAFKLHQFISQTFPLYASLEDPATREFGTEPISPSGKTLYPVHFCRTCGQEYYRVFLRDGVFEPAYDDFNPDSDSNGGYLAWNPNFNPAEDLPEHWFDAKGNLKKIWKERAPQLVFVDTNGNKLNHSEGGLPYYFQKQPFSLCISCGADWSGREREFTKLTYLGSEGRTSAATVLAVALLRKAKDILGDGRDKLLTFTDNRQDASLQAGHFNDFVRSVLLRMALYSALNNKGKLTADELPWAVLEALPLPISEFAENPAIGENTPAAQRVKEALAEVVRYRLYADLRRAWRYAQPNLEDVGLLEVVYPDADTEEFINKVIQLFAEHGSQLDRSQAREAVYLVLDMLRKRLAIQSEVLDPSAVRRLAKKTSGQLNDFWKIDLDSESTLRTSELVLSSRSSQDRQSIRFSARSRLGKEVVRRFDIPKEEIEAFAVKLVELFTHYDLLREVNPGSGQYRIPESAIVWRKGSGVPKRDPLWHKGNNDPRVNKYFQRLYEGVAEDMARLEAKEHTAQVPPEEREERERRFRGEDETVRRLPYLVASPTLELGVDIADLDMVHLRNLPPTPANYAQRVGRAGRQGQPGLVAAYAGSFSNHDRYYFRRREEMVAGNVRPPALDLKNESLLRSHVHAEWLATTGLPLRDSLADVVNIEEDNLPLYDSVKEQLQLTDAAQKSLVEKLKRVLAYDLEELGTTGWFEDDWLVRAVERSPKDFDRAMDAWRELYGSAKNQLKLGYELSLKGRGKADSDRGDALITEAKRQIDLLLQRDVSRDEGDFYPYRYLAAEEFLPGYNLMALPVRAWVPRRGGEFINRPRHLAITELAPGNTLYHEGRKWMPARLQIPPGGVSERVRRLWICKKCGHAADKEKHSICPNCGNEFSGESSILAQTIDFVGVTMKRWDRITANEEERMRGGYVLELGYEFSPRSALDAKSDYGDGSVSMLYAPATQLHYVNLGNKRSASQGFLFDIDTGEIISEKEWENNDASAHKESRRVDRFGLHVSVTQNALLIKVSSLPLDSIGASDKADAIQSLAYALKRGIERYYQVEESELGLELVGSGNEEAILFHEQAEGGLGVLRRLVEEPDGLARVAATALEVLHFSETGIDQSTSCGKACYECLLSYSNQRIANKLDRHLAKEPLLRLRSAVTKLTIRRPNNDEQLDRLKKAAQSGLEKKFLEVLAKTELPLPDEAQYRISEAHTVADFLYRQPLLAIFIDGPHHNAERQARIDQRQRDTLRELGYRPIVIRAEEINAEDFENGGLSELKHVLNRL